MNIVDGKSTFSKLFPDMMKATRLLIIDHDVCRYHSFDLIHYQLYLDALEHSEAGLKHFSSIKPEYQILLNAKTDLATQIQFMQRKVEEFNVYDCFSEDLNAHELPEYSAKVNELLNSQLSTVTPTDINSRLGIIFDRKGITGYLLQYRNDQNHPTYRDKLVCYQDDNILDLRVAKAIVLQHQINAIMIASAERAIQLAMELYQSGYTKSITFMMGRYAYNFHCEKGEMLYPLYAGEMNQFEFHLKHEFGYFDPFSGLTYRSRVMKTIDAQ